MAERKLPGSFRVQILALLLAFLGALALLAQAYGSSAQLSQKAARLNRAVGLARNAAEVFAGCGNLEQAALLLGGEAEGEEQAQVFFDKKGENCTGAEAAYRLAMRQEREPAGKGELLTCEIQIFWAEDGQELYTLTTACYRPDEEGGGL